MESRKVGRPRTGNAKEIVIRCRISQDLCNRLEKYCKENSVTKTEVMIKGIEYVIKK